MDYNIINNKISGNKYYFCIIYNILTSFNFLIFKNHIKYYNRIPIDEKKIWFVDDNYYNAYSKYIKNGFIGEDINNNKTLFLFNISYKNSNNKVNLESIVNFIVHNDNWKDIIKVYIIFEKNVMNKETYNEINEYNDFINILYEKDLITNYLDEYKINDQNLKRIRYEQNINIYGIPIY